MIPKSCKGDKPLIGVALPNTTNPYYVAMRQGFIDGAKELGFEVNVQIANDDNEAQLGQVQGFIQQGICALALNGVKSGPAAAEAAAAYKAGIAVFTVKVIVSAKDLEAQHAEIVDYVGADNFAGGKQIGEQVLKDYGPDAKLVIGIVTEPNEKALGGEGSDPGRDTLSGSSLNGIESEFEVKPAQWAQPGRFWPLRAKCFIYRRDS
jgi:ribose transport system substrate-binding protein